MKAFDQFLGELKRNSVPLQKLCGVYFLFSGDEIVYIGQSRNVPARVQHHMGSDKEFDRYSHIVLPADSLNEWESFYIHLFQPRYNKGDYNHGRRFKKAPMMLPDLVRLWGGRISGNPNAP
jgi:hypothetical protein